jgi:hypothetical protein
VERAQANQQKTKKPIDSTNKSKQNLKKALRDIHRESDVEEEQH